MSYILEALKKADAERNAGTRASIHAPLPFGAPGAQASMVAQRSLVWIAVAAAVAAGGALAWWLLPREQPVRLAAPMPQAAAPVPAPVPAPVTVPAPAAPAAPAASAAARPAREDGAEAGKPPLRAERKTPEKKTAAAPPARNPKPEKPAEPAPASNDAGLPSLRDLPDSIRTQVPSLTIAGFIYSANKADRSVLINNRLLREGDEVTPGLRLERMGPNWMVLDWHGTRFRHSY